MQLYNTLTRRKEPFEPQHDPISMYVCGITPYDDAHLGHAMSIIVFDVLRRYLEWGGRAVRLVYNFTDIDDKMIARAHRLGISVPELAAQQIDRFQQEWRELNIRAADVHPRATQEIEKMQEVIGGLIDKDAAYAAAGDVYFRVQSPPDYGKLSNRSLDDMIAGARIEQNSLKAHPMDFTLWKGAKPGEPAWDSPWGPGRPGWHIECSAMALRYLGEQIDLHGGGMDLIFPHHENEIAQSEGFTGEAPFVTHWVHNAMMQLGDEKMSKSLGNIISLRQGLDQYGADGLRLFILNGHYRSPLTYSEESLVASARGAERLRIAANVTLPDGDGDFDVNASRARFRTAMDDDLSTPQALAVLFDLAHELNRAATDGRPAGATLALLRELGGVLGLRFEAPEQGALAAPFIDLLVDVRRRLRDAKQYELADQVRDDLLANGVVLEDSRDGTQWRTAAPSLESVRAANPATVAAATGPNGPLRPAPEGKEADTLRF
ncbi:MAG: cysteinyl-tRNA synthetase [Chloroflexi bacterium]|nr:MAG: cysteinyl-tRNA synthetase [Chloroflexota bacterium]